MITLALDAEDPVMVSAVHETVHRIRETTPEMYQELANFVLDNLSEESAAFNQATREALYGTDNVDALNEEIVADAFGTMLENSKVLEQFTTEHRSAAQKIMDALHDLLVKIERALGNKEVRLSENQKAAFRDLSGKVGEMETLFAKALETTQEKAGSKNAANEGGEGKFSIKNIAGDSGKQYGIGVYLDNDLLTGLSDAERKQMVRLRVVEELAGNSFIAYDNGNPVEISIAHKNERIRNNSGNKKPVLKELYNKHIGNETKQEAVVLADELIEASKHDRTEASAYSHEWLDNYGKNNWEKRTVYLQDKNKTVWEATLQIANSADGRKILYDIDPIKMTEGAIKSAPTTVTSTVPQTGNNVKTKFSLKTIDEMEQDLIAMNEEYRGLERQDAEFQTVPEYIALMDAIGDARASKKSLLDKPEALSKALDSYSVWQEKSGYSNIIHRMEELRGEMKTLRGKLESAKTQAAQEAKAATRAGYSEGMAKSYATKAARKFGTTSNFDLAGYLTVNGKLLDFSDGQGYRVRDHREITEVLDFLPADHGYSDGMIEFMNLGNIRLQSYGIDISKAPNTAQRAMLRKFFLSKNGYVTVDFSDENGRSVGSLEYDRGTSADRILNDIDTYFQTGGIPDQSIVSQFHGKYSLKTDTLDPNEIMPVNTVTDKAKYAYLVNDFRENGYEGRPVVVYETPYGFQALTGSHRILAAQEAGIDIPAVLIDNPEAIERLGAVNSDDELQNVAQELFEEGLLDEATRDILAREEALNDENYDVPYDEQKRYSLKTREVLDEYIAQYGEMPAGETPHRRISVPKRTAENKYVSQTIRTVLEAKATPDALVPTLEDMVAKGDFGCPPFTRPHFSPPAVFLFVLFMPGACQNGKDMLS